MTSTDSLRTQIRKAVLRAECERPQRCPDCIATSVLAVVSAQLERSARDARECARNTDAAAEMIRTALQAGHRVGATAGMRTLYALAADVEDADLTEGLPDLNPWASTRPVTYLVWSNTARSWWGPNGSNYTSDVWAAGRYDEAEAAKACGMRTWSQGCPPPEVMVLAPEDGRAAFTVDDIRAVPDLMKQRINEATRKAAAERKAAEQLASSPR